MNGMTHAPRNHRRTMSKKYLGDSVYVAFDGYGLILTTGNGTVPTNSIYLEPEVYTHLLEYAARLRTECGKEPGDADEA